MTGALRLRADALVLALTAHVVRNPRRFRALAAFAALLSVGALARVRITTDVTELVRSPAARTLKRAAHVFGLDEQALLLVESERPAEEALLRFARALAQRLGPSPLVARVEFGIPIDPARATGTVVVPLGPLYFPPGGVAELDRLLTPAGLDEQLAQQASRMRLPGLGPAEEWIERDPLELGRGFVARIRSLQGGYRFAPGRTEFLSEDGRSLLVVVAGTARAGGLSGALAIVREVEAAVAALRVEPWAQDLRVSATGGYHFSEENERVIRTDMTASITSSVLVCLLVVAFGLRVFRARSALVLCLPTFWGTLVGFGAFAAIEGSLSLMSLGCAALLVGLGSDYSVHVASSALDLRAAGAPTPEAIAAAVLEKWPGILGSLLTSVVTFLAYRLSDQVFLREMGLLTSAGLVACAVGAVGLMPALLGDLLDREGQRPPSRSLGSVAAATLGVSRPRLVVAASALLAAGAVAALAVAPPELERDLRNVQLRTSAALATQARIATTFGGSLEPLLILLEGETEDEVVAASLRLEPALAALREDRTLVSRASIAALVPPAEDQRRCLDVLASKDPAIVLRQCRAALESAGFEPEAFADYLAGVGRALGRRDPVTLETLRRCGLGALLERFVVSRDGRWYSLVVASPREELWDPRARAALKDRLDAAILAAGGRGALTSLYLVSDESAAQVAVDFLRVTAASVLGVVLVVAVQFRRPRTVLLVLLPPVLGMLWTASLFSLLGYKLNLMNLGVLPMLFGVGVDDGIYPVARVLARPAAGIVAAYRFVGSGVMLCMVTTMVSFGSFAVSGNRGLSSVGVLSFAGLLLCLVVSLVTLPAVLELLRRRDARA